MGREVHTMELRFSADKAAKDAAKLDRQFDQLDSKAAGAGKSFNKLGLVLQGLGIGLLARDMVKTIVETERMKGSLVTMTGSMENANKAFAALEVFAKTTPFTMEQSVNAFTQLKSLGLEPTAAALTSFGNTAAAMGKDMSQMIGAVADASTMEFERLKEFGIKAKSEGDKVQFTFQGVTTEIEKNSKEIVKYLQNIGETTFAGAMEEQMKRLPGKISNLQDAIRNLWRTLGDTGVTEGLGKIVDYAASLIERLGNSIKSGFAADAMKIQMDAFLQPIRDAFAFLGGMDKELAKDIGSAWGTFFKFLIDEGPMLLVDTFTLLPYAWQLAVDGILETGGAMVQTFKNDWELIKKYVGIAGVSIVDGFQGAFDKLRLKSAELHDDMLNIFADMGEKIGATMLNIPWMKDLGEAMLNAAAAARENATALETQLQKQAARQQAYDDTIAAIEREIKILQDQNEMIDANMRGQWEANLKLLQARRDSLVAAREEARATAEANLANVDMVAILNELGKSKEEQLEIDKALKVANEAGFESVDALRKAFEALEDKLDPVIAKKRKLEAIEKLLKAALDAEIISQTRFNQLMAEVPKLLDDNIDAHDRYVKSVERGIERIDDAFGNMWADFIAEGQLTFDSVQEAFSQMIGDMIHEATTRTIKLQIDKAMAGEKVDWGAVGGSVLTGIGTIGGAALGGGGSGAATGSSIGALVGMFALSGPWGALIGGLVGGLLGGIFDKDPQLNLSGRAQGKTQQQRDTALGTIFQQKGAKVGGINNFGTAAAIADEIERFDQTIADMLDKETLAKVIERMKSWDVTFEDGAISAAKVVEDRFDFMMAAFDEGVQKFVAGGLSFEEKMKRFGMAMVVMNEMSENAALFGERTFTELLTVAEGMQKYGEDLGDTFKRLIDEMIQAQAAMEYLQEFLDSDLATAFEEAATAQGRTLYENLMHSAEAAEDMATEFDGTLSSILNLTDGVRTFGQYAAQTLMEIQNVMDSVAARFSTARESVIEQTSTREENLARWKQEIDTLAQQLMTAVDPAEIERLTAQIDTLSRKSFGALTDEEKAAQAPALLEYLSWVEGIAQQRLEQARQTVLDKADELKIHVQGVLDTIVDPLLLVAQEHGIAAEALLEAGLALNPNQSHDYSGATGGDNIGDQKWTNDLNSVIATTEAAASVLSSEGAAYRAATAQMVNAVYNVLSTRQVVYVKSKNGELV